MSENDLDISTDPEPYEHRLRNPRRFQTLSKYEVWLPWPVRAWYRCPDDSDCGRNGHKGYPEKLAPYENDVTDNNGEYKAP